MAFDISDISDIIEYFLRYIVCHSTSLTNGIDIIQQIADALEKVCN